MKFILAAALVLFPVHAFACPEASDHSVALNELIREVQTAPDQQSAQVAANEMWALWTDAPDATAQEILDRGMQRRAAWDLLGALEDFDTLIAYCPEFAEGYNQRAFVNFLRQDFEVALADLDRAVDLAPRHIAAMAGRALALIGLGRKAEAQVTLRKALMLNPWLPERGLLPSLELDSKQDQMPGQEL